MKKKEVMKKGLCTKECKKDGKVLAKHKMHKKEESNRTASKIKKVLHEYKEGALHSGSKKGPEVTNKKQALAIAFSEAKKAAKKKKK